MLTYFSFTTAEYEKFVNVSKKRSTYNMVAQICIPGFETPWPLLPYDYTIVTVQYNIGL